MSSPAPAPAKKATKPKDSPAHPKYSEMVTEAVTSLKERGGSSRQAILKYICKNFNVGDNEIAVNARVKTALRSGVKNEVLKQSKGTGASGSFKLGEAAKKAPKPKVVKPKAAKPKKVKTPVKAAKPKKTKKSPKKADKPKKVKKSVTPKKAKGDRPKNTKTPKKTEKLQKAKTPKPKTAAKKPAAKKATKK